MQRGRPECIAFLNKNVIDYFIEKDVKFIKYLIMNKLLGNRYVIIKWFCIFFLQQISKIEQVVIVSKTNNHKY